LHYLGIRRSAFRVHLYDLAIAAFLVLGIVNIATMSPNPERIGPAFFDKIVVPIVIFWYVRSIGVTPRDVGRLCVLGCVVILTQTGVGVMSWVAPSLLPDAWLVRAGERTAGTFGGPAPFTITLTLFALLAIHFAGQREVGWRRGALIAIAGVALLGVVFSLSRGSWLGTAGAGFGLLVLYPRIVAPIAVVSGLVIALLAVGPLQEQATYAAVRLETESTIDDRLVTNDASLRMIEDRPLSGFGFQNFERFDEAYKQRVGDIPLKIGGSSHNTYLNMAVEMGLPGVALYFSPVLALLVATVASRRSLRATGVISWPLAAVLWMALFDQFLVSNFLEMVHAYSWGTSLWWLTLGLIAAILEREHERAEDGREADAAPDSTGWRS
jgi:O-antigen ligase